jgi:hypothetical protein
LAIMEEFEAPIKAPLSRTNGGKKASIDRRFAEIQQAALCGRTNGHRVNGAAGGARLESPSLGELRLCLPLLGRFYLVRVGPAAKADQAATDSQADTGARTRIMLLAANVVIGFVAAVMAAVYALYGDAPFIHVARETGFFLLRQISVVRDFIAGLLSFSLF